MLPTPYSKRDRILAALFLVITGAGAWNYLVAQQSFYLDPRQILVVSAIPLAIHIYRITRK
jgi:hypothetical protein